QEKNVIDMIVIGAYGHSKIRQFFIGSTRGSRDFPL
ncbi:universal stress protein, partial [Escherichia coli]